MARAAASRAALSLSVTSLLSLSMMASMAASSPSVGGTPAMRSYMRLASSRAPACAGAEAVARPTPSANALTDATHDNLFFFNMNMALNLPLPATCDHARNTRGSIPDQAEWLMVPLKFIHLTKKPYVTGFANQ